jgi:hypothetical protein
MRNIVMAFALIFAMGMSFQVSAKKVTDDHKTAMMEELMADHAKMGKKLAALKKAHTEDDVTSLGFFDSITKAVSGVVSGITGVVGGLLGGGGGAASGEMSQKDQDKLTKCGANLQNADFVAKHQKDVDKWTKKAGSSQDPKEQLKYCKKYKLDK